MQPMVMADDLPFVPTEFRMSTFDQVDMMKKITRLINENAQLLQQLKEKNGLLEKRH